MSLYVPILQQYAPPPPDILDLQEICERSGVLRVCLVRSGGPGLHIVLSDHPGFRKADEGDLLTTLDTISRTSRLGLSFHRVDDSDHVRWFIAQGHGIRQAASLTHIAITTIDDVIDVISLGLPSLSIPPDQWESPQAPRKEAGSCRSILSDSHR